MDVVTIIELNNTAYFMTRAKIDYRFAADMGPQEFSSITNKL
jgi:hypothetical protein